MVDEVGAFEMIDLPLGVNIGRCSFLLQIKVLSFCKENQRSLCFFLFFLKVHCKYSYQLMAYGVLNVKAYTVFLFIWDGLNSNHRMVLYWQKRFERALLVNVQRPIVLQYSFPTQHLPDRLRH